MFDSTAAVALAALALFAPVSAQNNYTLSQGGHSGVAAMQLTVATDSTVVIIDKFEQNVLHDENNLPVWGALYSTKTDTARALRIITNSLCATGTWISNGTCEFRLVIAREGVGILPLESINERSADARAPVVNLGGNPMVSSSNVTATNGIQGKSPTPCLSWARFLQAPGRHYPITLSISDLEYCSLLAVGLRTFDGCPDSSSCDIREYPTRVRITSPRWYPSSARMADGGAFIFGGAYGGSWTNFKELNNPTYEFYPPKNIHGYNGLQIPSQFLKDSLPHNMYPHLMQLPNNDVFVAQTNTEARLPNLPNGQIVTYPYSGAGVLLPLTPENNYTPEVLLCGGSQLDPNLKENEVSSQSLTSAQCSRMVLTPAGIATGWKVESMPYGRVMPHATILPDGKILIVNGAKTGTAEYGNVPDQIGQSNADNPAFQPLLYDPAAPAGSRFSSTGMPTSGIARLYHSVATLLPDGRVMIAGSNPNVDVETRKYRTEYQVEYISPPYMTKTRPAYSGLPATWN
ncbi:hypothetical protein FRC08_014291 [Ceratobasidium sp. 394]|nr:hypothetical protein FRC08_014291 [Ceratobasidium sp. 394]